MAATTLYEQVTARIEATPELRRYRDVIRYNWTGGAEHLRWALTAPVSEIVDWAKTIRPDDETTAASRKDDEDERISDDEIERMIVDAESAGLSLWRMDDGGTFDDPSVRDADGEVIAAFTHAYSEGPIGLDIDEARHIANLNPVVATRLLREIQRCRAASSR